MFKQITKISKSSHPSKTLVNRQISSEQILAMGHSHFDSFKRTEHINNLLYNFTKVLAFEKKLIRNIKTSSQLFLVASINSPTPVKQVLKTYRRQAKNGFHEELIALTLKELSKTISSVQNVKSIDIEGEELLFSSEFKELIDEVKYGLSRNALYRWETVGTILTGLINIKYKDTLFFDTIINRLDETLKGLPLSQSSYIDLRDNPIVMKQKYLSSPPLDFQEIFFNPKFSGNMNHLIQELKRNMNEKLTENKVKLDLDEIEEIKQEIYGNYEKLKEFIGSLMVLRSNYRKLVKISGEYQGIISNIVLFRKILEFEEMMVESGLASLEELRNPAKTDSIEFSNELVINFMKGNFLQNSPELNLICEIGLLMDQENQSKNLNQLIEEEEIPEDFFKFNNLSCKDLSSAIYGLCKFAKSPLSELNFKNFEDPKVRNLFQNENLKKFSHSNDEVFSEYMALKKQNMGPEIKIDPILTIQFKKFKNFIFSNRDEIMKIAKTGKPNGIYKIAYALCSVGLNEEAAHLMELSETPSFGEEAEIYLEAVSLLSTPPSNLNLSKIILTSLSPSGLALLGIVAEFVGEKDISKAAILRFAEKAEGKKDSLTIELYHDALLLLENYPDAKSTKDLSSYFTPSSFLPKKLEDIIIKFFAETSYIPAFFPLYFKPLIQSGKTALFYCGDSSVIMENEELTIRAQIRKQKLEEFGKCKVVFGSVNNIFEIVEKDGKEKLQVSSLTVLKSKLDDPNSLNTKTLLTMIANSLSEFAQVYSKHAERKFQDEQGLKVVLEIVQELVITSKKVESTKGMEAMNAYYVNYHRYLIYKLQTSFSILSKIMQQDLKKKIGPNFLKLFMNDIPTWKDVSLKTHGTPVSWAGSRFGHSIPPTSTSLTSSNLYFDMFNVSLGKNSNFFDCSESKLLTNKLASLFLDDGNSGSDLEILVEGKGTIVRKYSEMRNKFPLDPLTSARKKITPMYTADEDKFNATFDEEKIILPYQNEFDVEKEETEKLFDFPELTNKEKYFYTICGMSFYCRNYMLDDAFSEFILGFEFINELIDVKLGKKISKIDIGNVFERDIQSIFTFQRLAYNKPYRENSLNSFLKEEIQRKNEFRDKLYGTNNIDERVKLMEEMEMEKAPASWDSEATGVRYFDIEAKNLETQLTEYDILLDNEVIAANGNLILALDYKRVKAEDMLIQAQIICTVNKGIQLSDRQLEYIKKWKEDTLKPKFDSHFHSTTFKELSESDKKILALNPLYEGKALENGFVNDLILELSLSFEPKFFEQISMLVAQDELKYSYGFDSQVLTPTKSHKENERGLHLLKEEVFRQGKQITKGDEEMLNEAFMLARANRNFYYNSVTSTDIVYPKQKILEESVKLCNLMKMPFDLFTKVFRLADDEVMRMEINHEVTKTEPNPTFFSLKRLLGLNSAGINILASAYVDNFGAIAYEWNPAISQIAIGILCHPDTHIYKKELLCGLIRKAGLNASRDSESFLNLLKITSKYQNVSKPIDVKDNLKSRMRINYLNPTREIGLKIQEASRN